LLRAEDESYDTYQLQLKDSKLTKQPLMTNLPYWVVEAYVRPPRPLDLSFFRSKKLLDVYTYLSQAEIYASSPLIEDLDGLVEDETFMMIF